jgi:hypothetical protein
MDKKTDLAVPSNPQDSEARDRNFPDWVEL